MKFIRWRPDAKRQGDHWDAATDAGVRDDGSCN